MKAIAGITFWRARSGAPSFLEVARESLGILGPDSATTRALGQSEFLETHETPVGGDEVGPRVSEEHRLLMVADVRIDNRDELIAELGLGFGTTEQALILACWKRWGDQVPRHLVGDFAIAVWHDREQALTLARSPLASRGLYYHSNDRLAAFASLPQALGGVVARRVNRAELARRLGGGTYFGSRETVFAGIDMVEPGTLVRITAQARSISRFWDPRMVATVRRPRADAAGELAWQLERAVAACSGRTGGPLASQLSGGRDSGAVTSTAAMLAMSTGEEVLALTAAPRFGFPVPEGPFLNDESELAAQVASRYANIRHIVARGTRTPHCAAFDRANRVLPAPMGNPANFSYWVRLLEEASDEGVAVLLNGGNGNFSISLGGPEAVRDVMREDGLVAWARTARALIGPGGLAPRTLFNQSFGSHLPEWVHATLRARVWGAATHDYPAFNKSLRAEIASVGARPRSRPLESYRARIADIYLTLESGDNVGRGLYGIDVRDPTTDRRLVEFCLSLPAADLVGARTQRPIYDLAFADRVPAAVRGSWRRGIQGADWYEVYDPQELRAGMRRYAEHPLVRELLDLREVENLLDRWPASPGDDLATYNLFANHLLGAVALASWLYVNF